jgi:hypothetical protein
MGPCTRPNEPHVVAHIILLPLEEPAPHPKR